MKKPVNLFRPLPLAVVSLGTAAVVTAALLSPFGTSEAAAAGRLTAFADCAEFEKGMRELAIPRVDSMGLSARPMVAEEAGGGFPNPFGWIGDLFGGDDNQDVFAAGGDSSPVAQAPAADVPAAAAPAAAEESESLTGGLSSPNDAVGNAPSGTNVQEAGVDEADLAKTDGKLVVSVVGGFLRVVDVTGTEPRMRGGVELRGLRPSELLLDGDRVLVVSADRDRNEGRIVETTTSLSVVDVADPDRPVLLGTEHIGARYLSARLVDGVARVVLSAMPNLPFVGYDSWSPQGNGRTPMEENRRIVEEAKAADWLPTRRLVDEDRRTVEERPLLGCTDVRRPSQDSGVELLTVLGIDTRSPQGLSDLTATAVVANGDLVYSTAERLFVATTPGGWGGFGQNGTSTELHSFDITRGRAEYVASGSVEGYVYGRWAMSERDGLLRVVTTSNAPWERGGSTQTGVVVLKPVGDRLEKVGSVGGMGLTETVRSVRWFDDLAAIVTFRQTDPLYLVDLSDPTRPRVRGELKIPGYSSYLHPIGDRRLLGLGQDANSFGQTKGLQLSSFDILDVADPKRTDALEFGQKATSPIEEDPRGFVYLPEQRLAVFPMNAPVRYCKAEGRCLPAGQQGELPYGPGLVSVRVAKDGKLERVAAWDSHLQGGLDNLKALPLPGGRIVLLDGKGVSILDASTLVERGRARF